jgi:CheY-like chemotaxis protein
MIRPPGLVRRVAPHRAASHKEQHMTRQALGILIIEDDRGMRELLRRHLEARGCRVTATNNGAEGLQAIVLDRFDAVVSDVVMLPRGGLWLWREARRSAPSCVAASSSAAPTRPPIPSAARPARSASSQNRWTWTPSGPRSSR